MMSSVKVATINVQGLQDPKKRKLVFQTLKDTNYDIFALQETHSTQKDHKSWQNEWGAETVWNSKSSQSGGTALIFHPNFDFELIFTEMDYDGRITRVTIKIENKEIQILNLKGPNPTSQEASEIFFESLAHHLDVMLATLTWSLIEIWIDKVEAYPLNKPMVK